ncbi:hypothetical protein BDV96DRAFT_642465 [Lophiotrema nucula]|uniref:Uncharacterized protein n=1 Tax=Lophiotrema nucula TaxID=690887 RepID=A0A6A5ZMI0_9PLEO|nr:hypothetical protein BDV96DRAFT_642465 [Lophiotrema nucula]
MSQPSKPPGTATCYYLSYAANWSYKIAAPYAHLPLCLARISESTLWLLCQFQRPKQVWQLLHAFDPREIDEYLSDNEEDIRILGWEDGDANKGVSLYFDLQFQERDDLLDWCRHVLDAKVKRGSMLLSSLEMIQIFQEPPAQRSVPLPNTISYPCVGLRGSFAALHNPTFTILSTTAIDQRFTASFATATTLRTETTLSSASLRKAMEKGLKIRKRAPEQLQSAANKLQPQQVRMKKDLNERRYEEVTEGALLGDHIKAQQQNQGIVSHKALPTVLVETSTPTTATSTVSRSRKHWSEEWDFGARPPKRRKKSKKAPSREDTTMSMDTSAQSTQSTLLASESTTSSRGTAAEDQQRLCTSSQSSKTNGVQPPSQHSPLRKEQTSNEDSQKAAAHVVAAPQVEESTQLEVQMPQKPCHPDNRKSPTPFKDDRAIIDLGDDSNPSTQQEKFVDHSSVDKGHEIVEGRDGSPDSVLGPTQQDAFVDQSALESGRVKAEARDGTTDSVLGLVRVEETTASQELGEHCYLDQPKQAAVEIDLDKAPAEISGADVERHDEQVELVNNPRASSTELTGQGIPDTPQLCALGAGLSTTPPLKKSLMPETSTKQAEGTRQPRSSSPAASFQESLSAMLERAETDPATTSSPLIAQCVNLLKIQHSMIAETRAEVAALRNEVGDLRARAG